MSRDKKNHTHTAIGIFPKYYLLKILPMLSSDIGTSLPNKMANQMI